VIEGAATAVLALIVGCGDNPAAIPIDGGDAGFECTGTAPVCDGLTVKACDHNLFGATMFDCTAEGACSEGRCLSPACAAVEHDRKSLAGCQFYTAQADNVASDADAFTSFLITNPGSEPATVSIEHFATGSWAFEVPLMTVAAGSTLRLPVHGLQVKEAGAHDGGLRLNSDHPVTVAQIESDDVNRDAKSSGGTMLLPVHVLGTHYMAMTYPQQQTPELAALADSPSGAGRILIVGTQASTEVTVRLSDSATGVEVGEPSLRGKGAEVKFELDDGEVYQLWTGNSGDDLSGTEITTSLPVAVFSGNITTTYGLSKDNLHSPDMTHEQMPPVYAWSHKYVAASLPPQAGTCDTLLGVGASLWRLMVWGTKPSRIDIMVPGKDVRTETLESGQVMDVTEVGDFVVTSSEPLLMTQGIDCEPSLSLAISADMFIDDLSFAVLPSFDQMAAIVRQNRVVVLFDGAPIDDVNFKPAGGGFEVARLPIPTCPATAQACMHRLQGRFGVTMRGMDIVASYALTAPALDGCIDTSDPRCLQ